MRMGFREINEVDESEKLRQEEEKAQRQREYDEIIHSERHRRAIEKFNALMDGEI